MIEDVVRNAIVAILIFMPLERLFPRNRKQRAFRHLWSTDFVYMFLGALINTAGIVVMIMVGGWALDPLIGEPLKATIAAQPIWLQLVEFMIVADIGFYAIHRLFHEVPALWKFHAIHHSIEEMDWLAAHRVHPIDQTITAGGSLVVPMALGFSVEAVVLFGFLYGIHSYLKHSNVNVSFGVFRWLLVSPVYHHWHHCNQPGQLDKNFAAQLPFLDILFGTAITTAKDAPDVYGTDTMVPDTFTQQLAAPFVAEPEEVVTN